MNYLGNVVAFEICCGSVVVFIFVCDLYFMLHSVSKENKRIVKIYKIR